jgi:putative flippase GtrA
MPVVIWQTLGRHQLGAIAATAVDFGTMVFVVERFGVAPASATAVGATVGALTNFALGRSWIFRQHTGHWASQAVRYAMVSGASALWNTLGELLLHDGALVPYLPARVVVSVAVSLLWNFPVQRRFVFREGVRR